MAAAGLCYAFPAGEARVKVGKTGRRVLIVHRRPGEFYACDFACHHQGADLGVVGEADRNAHPDGSVFHCQVEIEDLASGCAVVCPRHRRRIALASGELCEPGLPPRKVQRVHACEVVPAADGRHGVQTRAASLQGFPGPVLESDSYNAPQVGEQGCASGGRCARAAKARSAVAAKWKQRTLDDMWPREAPAPTFVDLTLDPSDDSQLTQPEDLTQQTVSTVASEADFFALSQLTQPASQDDEEMG